MHSYCSEIVVFMKTTTIKQLICVLPGQAQKPPNFDILMAKIGADIEYCTIEKINTIRRRYCSEAKLSEVIFHCIFIIESDSEGSLIHVPRHSFSSPSRAVPRHSFSSPSRAVSRQSFSSPLRARARVLGFSEDSSVTAKINALIKACENGDTETVKRLLETNTLREGNKASVLMIASKNGHDEVITLLLDYGVDVNMLNEKGQYALMISSQHGHVQVVQLLLQRGAQSSLQDNNGLSSLMIASQNNHLDIIELLLKHGAQIDAHSGKSWTALMYASWSNHIRVVETLLKRGAHVDKEFLTQLSPIRHQEVLGILNKQLGM